MTTTERILRDIENAPTIMDKAMEQDFCRRLMGIGPVRIVEEWPVVCHIVARLSESHTQVIFEVESAEDFGFFSRWVQQFSSQYPDTPQATALALLAADLADVFLMDRQCPL